MSRANCIKRDLDQVWPVLEPLWKDLKGARLLVTGGTGFIGTWLLESLCYGADKLNSNIQVEVFSRHPESLFAKAPHLASHPIVTLRQGNVLNFPALSGAYSHLIHAATEASAYLIKNKPLEMFHNIIQGTRNVLEWAAFQQVRTLFLSSGAVYGPQTPDLTHIPDQWPSAPNCNSAIACYAESKRAAETLCAIFQQEKGLDVCIARCFAFVGPYLPMEIHYAIGNFLRDALHGGPIIVKGDGLTTRSYLYASDMVVWLWYIFLQGTPNLPINVGSEEAISMGALAAKIADMFNTTYHVQSKPLPGLAIDRYVPSTAAARAMGLKQGVGLEEGIRRMAEWYSSKAEVLSSNRRF